MLQSIEATRYCNWTVFRNQVFVNIINTALRQCWEVIIVLNFKTDLYINVLIFFPELSVRLCCYRLKHSVTMI